MQNAVPVALDSRAELLLLSQIAQRINLGNSVQEIIDLVFERLRGFVPCNRIAVAVLNEARDALVVHALRSDGPALITKDYTGVVAGSSLAELLREGRSRVIADLPAYLKSKPSSASTQLVVKEGMRSSLTLPLIVEGRPVGVMFFSSREVNSYRAEHERFLASIVGHVAIAIERTLLVERLREKTRYLESILEHSADAIIVLDPEERVRTWNAGACRMYGFQSAEVLGRSFRDIVPNEEIAGEYDALIRRLNRDGYVKDHECRRITRDGRRITVNVTTNLLTGEEGRIIGRSAIHRDVTHMRRLQEELVRSRSLAAVGELAATVAHEIKNPLAGISGAVQILQDAIPATDRRRPVVGDILDQIRRLDKTVRDLLAFSRPMTPSKRSVRPSDILLTAWSLLAQQPEASGVRFTLTGERERPMHADPDLLHQVWINLIQNAIEAMPRGGDIQASVEEIGEERVCMTLRDSGVGIAAKHSGALFRPFFTTKTQGTGLGLAISRKIVEAHGGTIRLESQPGQGATVTMEIPR